MAIFSTRPSQSRIEYEEMAETVAELKAEVSDNTKAINQLIDMVNQPALILKNFELTDKEIEAIRKAKITVVAEKSETTIEPSLPADYEMYTRIWMNGDLSIGFHDGKYFKEIGCLSKNKRLYILSTGDYHKNYKLWREKGCLYNDRTVEFKGGKYGIVLDERNGIIFEREDIDLGRIYNISGCFPFQNCDDPNILRHEHNNVPIIF